MSPKNKQGGGTTESSNMNSNMVSNQHVHLLSGNKHEPTNYNSTSQLINQELYRVDEEANHHEGRHYRTHNPNSPISYVSTDIRFSDFR